MSTTQDSPAGPYNPWREFIENCIDGSNYFRAREYRELIEELDGLYALKAAALAPPSPPEEWVEEAMILALALDDAEDRKEWHRCKAALRAHLSTAPQAEPKGQA